MAQTFEDYLQKKQQQIENKTTNQRKAIFFKYFSFMSANVFFSGMSCKQMSGHTANG